MADITTGTEAPIGGTWRKRDPNAPIAPPAPVDPNAPRAQPLAPGQAFAPPSHARPAPMATATASSTGAMGAFGLTPEQVTANQQQTGVNAGGTGYVSGQVAPTPGGGALAALGAPTTTPVRTTSPAFDPAGADDQGWRGTRAPTDTTTVTSGLTTGAPPRAPTAPPGGDIVSTTSALTGGGGSQAPNNNTGTTPGYSPVPSQVRNAIGGVPIVGPLVNDLTTTAAVDLTPTKAAQRAAFGIQDDLSQERFDYRPGAAAAMDLNTDVRRQQLEALGGLRDAANGSVASAAELQGRREAGKAVAATLGQARALGARSAGGAARAGTMASADILARSAADSAQLRAQEQDTNRQRLMAALGQTRGQDTDVSGANLKSQLEQNQLAEQHRRMLLDAQLTALGTGTKAAGDTVNGGRQNADAENKSKSAIWDTVTGLF